MNALDRFKEYFGMAPVAAYEDEYLDEFEVPEYRSARGDRRAEYGYRDAPDEYEAARHRLPDDYVPASELRDYDARDYDRRDFGARDYRDDEPEHRRRAYLRDEDPVAGRGRFRSPEPEPAPAGFGATRGAVALAPEEDEFADGLVTYPEAVVERPRGFADGKSLGENFRAGIVVVLDLSSLPKDDARRMVDFAAGLVFALDGGMQKVPDRERTFLLQPAGMDLTEAEVRETVHTAFRG